MTSFLRPVVKLLSCAEHLLLPEVFRFRPPKGPHANLPPLPIAGRVNYSWNLLDASDLSALVCDPMTKGSRWREWKKAMESRINERGGNLAEIVESSPGDTGTIYFTGEAVLDFIALFDVVILGDFPPKEHATAIKTKNPNCNILLGAFDFESISQLRHYNSALTPLRSLSKSNLLTPDITSGCNADGFNEYGCLLIDRNEATGRDPLVNPCEGDSGDWPAGTIACSPSDATVASTHRWACDVSTSYATGFTASLATILANGLYMTLEGFPDTITGVLFADCFDEPQIGTATNEYDAAYTAAAYQGFIGAPTINGRGWKGMLARMRSLFKGQVWADAADNLNTYNMTDLPRRLHSTWFTKSNGTARSLGELQAAVSVMLSAGATMIIGDVAGVASKWFTHGGPGGQAGTWADIRAKVSQVNTVGAFYPLTANTETGGYLMWQPEFREIA